MSGGSTLRPGASVRLAPPAEDGAPAAKEPEAEKPEAKEPEAKEPEAETSPAGEGET
jgi:hypothetical protein